MDVPRLSIAGYMIDVLSIAVHVAPDYISQSTTTSSQEGILTLDLDQLRSSRISLHDIFPSPLPAHIHPHTPRHSLLIPLLINPSLLPTPGNPDSFACSHPHLVLPHQRPVRVEYHRTQNAASFAIVLPWSSACVDATSEHTQRVHQRRSMCLTVGVLRVVVVCRRRRCGSFALYICVY